METKSMLYFIFLSWLIIFNLSTGQDEEELEEEEEEAIEELIELIEGGSSSSSSASSSEDDDLINELSPVEYDVIFTASPFGTTEDALLLTTNSLTGLQRIYQFNVEAALTAVGANFTLGIRGDPPPDVPPLICETRVTWLMGGGLGNTLAAISQTGLAQRFDATFAPSGSIFNLIGYIPPSIGPIMRIAVDCNDDVLLLTASGALYNLNMDDVEDYKFDEIEAIGIIPGISMGVPFTYDFVSGYYVTVQNEGNTSTIQWYGVDTNSTDGDECSIELVNSQVLTPANDCGDGDISAITAIGGPGFNVVCSNGAGSAGSPNTASVVLTPTSVFVNGGSSNAASTLFEGVEPILGMVPVNLFTADDPLSRACDIPDNGLCADVTQCD